MILKTASVVLIAGLFSLAICEADEAGTGIEINQSDAPEVKSFEPSGVVTDAADVFDAAEEQNLTAILLEYNESARHPIVVASVPSLEGLDAQTYADRLARKWKVGQGNRGVFFLIAPHEQQMWISVADGSLTKLPNERTEEIVETIIVPAYCQGNFYDGTKAAIDLLIAQFGQDD